VATKASRPGRTLIVFSLVVVVLYGLVALGGTWKPKLGLDLQGGTRITLEASTDDGSAPPPDKLQEAVSIIDSRVNGSGVTEAEVTTQGNRNIIVEIPGKNRKELVDTVKQTAQLRFRLVAAAAPGRPQAQQPTQQPTQPQSSGAPSGSPSADATAGSGDPSASPAAEASPSAKNRALSSGLVRADDQKQSGTDKTGKKDGKKTDQQSSTKPSTTPQPTPTAPAPTDPQAASGAPVDEPLQWMRNPGQEWLQKFQEFTCPAGKKPAKVEDIADQPLITCDDQGFKYLLSQAVIQGTQLTDASAGIPQNQLDWVVDLSFDSSARKTFGEVTQQLAGTGEQFAIVLDGQVISAPTVNQPILGGNAQITGNFSQAEAQSLANSLKYGALPLKFTAPVVSEEGPSLAADQLSAGITAGIIGLALVLIYCMFYYRGLGTVVFASLIIAAIITYALVLLMSSAVGFTLTLPGIAGLIVAVGITADSFIVYFERIRDEMRDGRSMRVAVESGWKRARNTCLAADAVSLLAAVILYIFAIGVVRGFAFALGLSTLIDLVVFFFFTKPMVSWLAGFRFFSSGHKLSGLSADHIGVARTGAPRTRTAGGNA
jgi:preprotein translocase subunit SecD